MLFPLLISVAIAHLFVAAAGYQGLAECQPEEKRRALEFRLLEAGGLIGATVLALLAATSP